MTEPVFVLTASDVIGICGALLLACIGALIVVHQAIRAVFYAITDPHGRGKLPWNER